MAITPTVLIAAKGLLTGDGIGINSVMTGVMTKVSSNPIISGVNNLQGQGIDSTLATLPPFISQAQPTIDSVTAQAQAIFPGGSSGVKSFISAFSSSSSFGALSAQFSSAIKEFSGKGFGDLGVNVNGFKDMLGNGVSGLLPNMSNATAGVTKDALKNVSSNLGNFGTLMDFKSLDNFGPKNLVASLQKQGLTSLNGIDDMISAAGYDPKNLSAIPDSALKNLLTQVQGSDLQKIISQTGAKVQGSVGDLSQLLNPQSLMSSASLKSLGINDFSMAGMSKLGNSLTNLGAPMDLSNLTKVLSTSEFKDFNFLKNLKSPLPTDVKAALSPYMGSGGGVSGNPTLTDMIGTVSGETHIESFKNINDALNALGNSPVGKNLLTSSQSVIAAKQAATAAGTDLGLTGAELTAYVNADAGVVSSLASATSAVNTFNSQAANNLQLSKLVDNANAGITNSLAQLSKETNNLSLAGFSFGGAAPSGVSSVLSFASKLHSFGVDKQGLGFSKLLDNCTTDNLSGDALRASLLEGRNVARSMFVNKSTSSVATQLTTDISSAKDQLSSLTTNLQNATKMAADGSPEGAALMSQAQTQLDTVTRMAANSPLA